MRVRVLGSSGGIGGRRRTTAFLVDDDILLDAGTGAGELELDAIARLRTVFLTHAHLDHVAGLFLLLDSLHSVPHPGFLVRALPETIDALSKNLSNDAVWPDFRKIPSADRPLLTFEPMSPGETLQAGERRITMAAVRHSIPAAGYVVAAAGGAFAFTGDTGTCPEFWEVLNRQPRLDHLVAEVSFPDSREEMARRTGHYHPTSLANDLKLLKHRPEIWLSHLKPGLEEEIAADCRRVMTGRQVGILRGGEMISVG